MKFAASFFRNCAVLAGQIALLWLVNWLCHFLVDELRVPVPGNVVAVIAMFLLLQTKVVPLEFVERSSMHLLRHLALFFMPIAVGLMTFVTLWISSGVSILVTLVASAFVGFAVTGCLCQRIGKLARNAAAPVVVPSHGAPADRS